MALRIKKSQLNAVGSTLAECEWNLPAITKKVPEWQLLTMLNYEYARCSKTIIQSVELLREANLKPKGGQREPRSFARFLVKHYPEFPGTPWTQIPESIRADRLALFGINEEAQFYPVELAWQAWELFSFEAENLREELNDESAKHYGVFNIDFSQDSTVVLKQFSAWLEQRRKEFKPGEKNTEPSGRAHKKRQYKDSLKALGGLRALKYWGSSEDAETMTNDKLSVGNRSWKRAKFRASETFARLKMAWTNCVIPFDPFDEVDMHSILPHELKFPFPSPDRVPKDQREKEAYFVRSAKVSGIVANDFVVSSLKTEAI